MSLELAELGALPGGSSKLLVKGTVIRPPGMGGPAALGVLPHYLNSILGLPTPAPALDQSSGLIDHDQGSHIDP